MLLSRREKEGEEDAARMMLLFTVDYTNHINIYNVNITTSSHDIERVCVDEITVLGLFSRLKKWPEFGPQRIQEKRHF